MCVVCCVKYCLCCLLHYYYHLGACNIKNVIVVNINITARFSSFLVVWPRLPAYTEPARTKACLLSSAVAATSN